MTKQVIEILTVLLQGKIPQKIDTEKISDKENQELAMVLNKLIDSIKEIHCFIIPLSQGEISNIKTSRNNFLASPFKELHSRLLHLTWQAEQVAKGDYSQRVDFMGLFSEAFNSMIASLDNRERQLKEKIDELENAHFYIRNLEGMLPICASCKKIRIEPSDPKKQDNWVPVECYITKNTNARFTHSICPECMKKLYPEFVDECE